MLNLFLCLPHSQKISKTVHPAHSLAMRSQHATEHLSDRAGESSDSQIVSPRGLQCGRFYYHLLQKWFSRLHWLVITGAERTDWRRAALPCSFVVILQLGFQTKFAACHEVAPRDPTRKQKWSYSTEKTRVWLESPTIKRQLYCTSNLLSKFVFSAKFI